MATAYKSDVYAANEPANTGHGLRKGSFHLHGTSASISFGLNDTVTFGYLPANAVVVGATLKAQSQLDSGSSLTIDLGVTGTTQLFKAAVTTVGRASGASVDTTIAAAGMLYKSGSSRIAVLATIHAAPATAVAGILECDIEYYVEDVAGSQA